MTAASRPYAEVIGDPVDHSKSPQIHNFWLKKVGIDAEYRATRVTRNQLGAYFDSRLADPLWLGCNVTMPLKEAVLDHVDAMDDDVAATRAANCIIPVDGRLGAGNFDSWGLFYALGLMELKDPAIVIGSGASARTALHWMSRANAIEAHVVSRRPDVARGLLARFELAGDVWGFGDRIDVPFAMLLINATPLGMTGQPPMESSILGLLDELPKTAAVLDMIYDPMETQLIARARSSGLQAVNGLAMLVGQARFSFESLFTARPPTDDADDEELGELLMQC